MHTLYHRIGNQKNWLPILSTTNNDVDTLINKAKEISTKSPIGDFCIIIGMKFSNLSSLKPLRQLVIWRSTAKLLSGTYKLVTIKGRRKLVFVNPDQLFLQK